MPTENVETAIRYFEATNLAEATELLDDDVSFVMHEESGLIGSKTLSGKAAAVAWLTDWFGQFDADYSMSVVETAEWGDRVLVVTRHRTTGRTSRVPVEKSTAQLMTVRGGKIVRQDFFADREHAIRVAGPK